MKQALLTKVKHVVQMEAVMVIRMKVKTSCMDKSKASYSNKVKHVVWMEVKPVFLDGSETICLDRVGYCCFFSGSFEIISFYGKIFPVFMLIFKLQLVKLCF